MQLLWNYPSLGITYNDITQVQVFGIEMVYVPQGSFYLRDGAWGGQGDIVAGHFAAGNTSDPFQMTSENALTLGGAPTTNLGNNNTFNMSTPDDFNFTTAHTLPAAFSKGFHAFYCMKYKITQQHYVEFLITLLYVQQGTNTLNAPNSAAGTNAFSTTIRNGIDIMTPGIANATPAVYACNLDGDATQASPPGRAIGRVHSGLPENLTNTWLSCGLPHSLPK